MRIVSLLICLLLLGVDSPSAQAVLAEYSVRGDWNTATGGPDFLVDFNTVTTDASYNDPDTYDAGPFVLGSFGADNRTPDPLNYVDAAPFRVSTFTIDGSTLLSSRLGSDSTKITIVFDKPITAFGADFARTTHTPSLTLTLNRVGSGNDTVTIPSIGATAAFFGVSDPAVAYKSLSIKNDGVTDAFFLMDNLSGVVAVPEPSAFLLFGVVSLGVWCRTRQSRIA